MKSIFRSIVSSIIGAGIFFVFFSLFDAGLLIAAGGALAGLIGSALFLSPKKINKKLVELEKVHGVTPAQLEKIQSKGKKKIRKMQRMARKVESETVKERILDIVAVAKQIFENFEYDPKDVRAARQFLNYYLDATIRIMDKYVTLSGYEADSDNSKTLEKVEEMMVTIENAFQKQLLKLQDDDYLDLDTEISVLEKSIKVDGLEKKKKGSI